MFQVIEYQCKINISDYLSKGDCREERDFRVLYSEEFFEDIRKLPFLVFELLLFYLISRLDYMKARLSE